MALLPEHRAPQHERARERAPRPLPLFLELVREVAREEPELARQALAGLRAYEEAPREPQRPEKPVIAQVRSATLREHGGEGPPALLVPSLINPPRILDLDEQVSLAGAIARMGRRSILLDWGPADARAELSVGAHIEELLLPLLASLQEPAAVIGYCLGGTMAIAAANLMEVERLVTLAAPWHFSAYPERSRTALESMWRYSEAAASRLGALPMEVLQAAFWSLDPERTVRKFAEFAEAEPRSPESRRFVELEEWANEGEPLPYPAARELIEDLFGKDLPSSGRWVVGSKAVTDALSAPVLHIAAARDLIAPPRTVARGPCVALPAGHVGMIVGSARAQLHERLSRFLQPACRPSA